MVFWICQRHLTYKNHPRNPKTWILNRTIFVCIMYQASRLHIEECAVQVSRESIKNWARKCSTKISSQTLKNVATKKSREEYNNSLILINAQIYYVWFIWRIIILSITYRTSVLSDSVAFGRVLYNIINN